MLWEYEHIKKMLISFIYNGLCKFCLFNWTFLDFYQVSYILNKKYYIFLSVLGIYPKKMPNIVRKVFAFFVPKKQSNKYLNFKLYLRLGIGIWDKSIKLFKMYRIFKLFFFGEIHFLNSFYVFFFHFWPVLNCFLLFEITWVFAL